MTSKLDLGRMFAIDAQKLIEARKKAIAVHPTDIRAAGDQIEEAVRNYLRRMLPPRYYVTHGHLIDHNHIVSPQIDVIIADNFALPSLVTTESGTEYIPATSALAIGEIKSTYYHSKGYFEDFHKMLVKISQMHRPLIENTMYQGMTLGTTMSDLVIGSPRKYLNNLFSFMFCVNGGNFEFEKVKPLFNSAEVDKLPNMSILLNKGVISYLNRQSPETHYVYPNEVDDNSCSWCFAPMLGSENGSVEGAHLSLLYSTLIDHLSLSHIRHENYYKYFSREWISYRPSLEWADQ